jgi:DNA invertase Pin-like site-specific DNA recombinase
MSRLILSVLASVAEFERDLIRERTRLGLRKARADGKRIGRPAVLAPATVAQVKGLRAAGHSWARVASGLGCTPSTARRCAVVATLTQAPRSVRPIGGPTPCGYGGRMRWARG